MCKSSNCWYCYASVCDEEYLLSRAEFKKNSESQRWEKRKEKKSETFRALRHNILLVSKYIDPCAICASYEPHIRKYRSGYLARHVSETRQGDWDLWWRWTDQPVELTLLLLELSLFASILDIIELAIQFRLIEFSLGCLWHSDWRSQRWSYHSKANKEEYYSLAWDAGASILIARHYTRHVVLILLFVVGCWCSCWCYVRCADD